MKSAIRLNPILPLKIEGSSLILTVWPLCTATVSIFATEFSTAVGPFTTLPSVGSIESTSGSQAFLPEGSAAVREAPVKYSDNGISFGSL